MIDLFFSLYKKPELLITVTGGASLSNLSQKSIKTICNGIIKVASSTSKFNVIFDNFNFICSSFFDLLAAWITTGGNYAGIMKEVGEYVNKTSKISKNPPFLLGIQLLHLILNPFDCK